MSIPDFFDAYRAEIDAALSHFLTQTSRENTQLTEAMRYSLLLGGKRVRPMLCLATAKALGTSAQLALHAACALEFIHAYSLVHDDLPAMDNDALRRGQPTCHIAFDEATAILTGDALQSSAFHLLTLSDLNQPDSIKLALVNELASAGGALGMVLGQAIDLSAVGNALSLETLEQMHQHKTGKLIEASVSMGAICASADQATMQALRNYAKALGLAFQVQDDILDVTGDTATIGKSAGADIALNKPTYVSLLGLEGAKEKLERLYQTCISSLNELHDCDITELEAIARYVVEREH
jgi:geranylgeranyl diphosphate synthase type II